MSDRTEKRETRTEKKRVLKSHQVMGVGLAFPPLEQVAGGDLPYSSSKESAALDSVAAAAAPAPPGEVDILVSAAREAEERAHAMERRAAALLHEAEETALERLQEVERRIEEMLTKAAAAVEHIEREARERGRSDGHEEGFQMGLEAGEAEGAEIVRKAESVAAGLIADARRQAEAILADAQSERNRLIDISRLQLVELSFAIARQVLKLELTLRPEAMLSMVEAALSKLKGEEEPQIRVGTDLLQILDEHRGRLLAAIPGARRLTIERDPSLQQGDFVVQGAHGVVDGRVEQQLKVLRESLEPEER